MMIHPTPYDDHAPRSLAIEEWRVVYHGRASHASADPHLGLNALDGVVQGYTAIGMLRQHLRPHQQVHGVIVDGGDAANVVPERTEASYYLRAVDLDDLEDLRARVRAVPGGSSDRHRHDRRDPRRKDTSTSRSTRTRGSLRSSPTPAGPSGATRPPTRGVTGSAARPTSATSASWCPGCTRTWPCTRSRPSTTSTSSQPRAWREHGDRTMLDGAKALALTALAVAAHPERAHSGPVGFDRAQRSRSAAPSAAAAPTSFDDIAIVPSPPHARPRGCLDRPGRSTPTSSTSRSSPRRWTPSCRRPPPS